MRILIRAALSLSLFLPLSFACSQFSEEIYGYDMGCPLVSETATQVLSRDERQKEYSDASINQWFDSVTIETVDGNIGKLVFIKKYKNEAALHSELPKVLKAMQHKWGGSMEQDFISKIYSYNTRVNKSDILHTISVKNIDKLTYEIYFMSKNYVEYYKDAMIRRRSASL